MAKIRSSLHRMDKIDPTTGGEVGSIDGNLKARCGLHDGPVTAGILRAKLSALWYTMNTASIWNLEFRKGRRPKQLPIFIEAGKSHWVSRRSVWSRQGKGLDADL
jgi:hypothetical protein